MIKPAACATALAATLMGAAAAPAIVKQRHSQAGMTLARHVLLRRADLGGGWSEESPAPQKAPQLTCPRFDPFVSRVTEVGAAASPTFQKSSSGPFVSQSAYVYATADQASTFWDKVVRPKLLRCVADSLANGSSQGVHFTVTGKRLLALPPLPVKAAGYHVSGMASLQYQTIQVYLDMIVLGRGSAVAQISTSSFYQPPSRRLELRLARKLARRLPAG